MRNGRTPSDPGRRRFLRETLAGGLSTAAFLLAPPWARRSAAAPVDLAAVEGSPAAAARRAVELLGGMRRFVKAGQRVVVKPNIGFDRVPEQAANTNPEVVSEVVRMALEAGAAEVLVFDRTSNDPKRCYRASGIEASVRGIGDPRARIFIPDDKRFVEVNIPGGVRVKRWSFVEDATRADVFINVPIAKQHSFSLLTMGLKNMMGAIGGNRSEMHDGFDDKIVDLNLARPSHLTVLDATRVLLYNGPMGGSLRDVGKPGVVVAAVNIVAADVYGTRFFGAKPGDVPHLQRAGDRGLGPLDLRRVSLREEKTR
jgi:uncharacterized protein (DUF362 family)